MNIYITTGFHGRVSNGTGHYVIAGGDPIKGFEGNIEHVSMPRFNALACLTAVNNVKEGADLNLTIQDPYSYSVISSGHCDGANKDIWDKFFKRISCFRHFNIYRSKDHELVGWRPERRSYEKDNA